MRKNSIRKLVHGILDLLPLFVIPIFAININQKSVEPISIEVQEKISVNFNQICFPLDIEQDLPQLYASTYENSVFVEFYEDNYSWTYQFSSLGNVENHIFYNKSNNTQNIVDVSLTVNGTSFEVGTTFTMTTNGVFNLTFNGNTDSLFEGNMNIFDLTLMFGSGNEPTTQQFDLWFDEVYPYTKSQKMLVDKPTPTTYDDTDIGSQFLYSLYISTDNYFNMNQVFNLNSVYQWFELNIFGGSAPLSIYIVWNIIIYELVMDLLMLLYALFMFFIDMCQRLIDKPLDSVK